MARGSKAMAMVRRVALRTTVAMLLAAVAGCRNGCANEGANGGERHRGTDDDAQERAVSREKVAPPGNLTDLAHEVGLTFPPSARLIGQDREAGMDDYLQFKVEIDVSDLTAFEASSPIPAQAMEPGAGGRMGPDHDFWDPHRAASLRTGQKSLPGARVLNIGIAESGNEVALYIVNHGT
jgi:hypothetical protein